jgi:serine/threonine protein kinase
MNSANPSQHSMTSDQTLPTYDDRGSFVDPLAGMIRRIANIVRGPLLGEASLFGPTLGDGERRYHVYKLLGRGGQAEVYAAWDRQVNRFVALKLFNPPLDSAMMEDRQQSTGHGTLRREAQHTAAASGSPNVIVVYELMDQEPALPYLVMEYAAGGPLKNWAAECRESVQLLVGWLRDIANALIPLHRAGRVHGDIKPENILLVPVVPLVPSTSGEAPRLPDPKALPRVGLIAKLADFGFAGRNGDLQGLTRGFADPQVIAGGKPSPQSDCFSLGATACWLLLGHAPGPLFDGDKYRQPTEAELCRVPGVNRDLAAVIRKATAEHDPDRYYSHEHLADDLNRLLLNETPLHAVHLSLFWWIVRWCRKKPWIIPLALIVIAQGIVASTDIIQKIITLIRRYRGN